MEEEKVLSSQSQEKAYTVQVASYAKEKFAHEEARGLKDKGYEIDKRGILLHEPIRELGEHEVEIRLSTEVSTKIKVSIQAEA